MNEFRYVDRFCFGSLRAAMLLSTLTAAACSSAISSSAIGLSIARAQEEGPLLICGGGDLPEAIIERFHELAGGEKARIVVIPTASVYADAAGADKSCRDRLLCRFQKRKSESLVLLHTRDRRLADQEQFVAPLRTATAVWISGGDQTRLADAYLGTAVERELTALRERGGAIGGTSAGAAIMSRKMIVGGQSAPHLGTGFDLLPGAVIDQHFLARHRATRLAAAVEYHGDCYGLGIDEGTAVVVRGGAMEIIGDSTATIYLPIGAVSRNTFQVRPGETAKLPELSPSGDQLVRTK